jgi:23S rRNA pseudouridine1911/1915/1917 synthase
MTSPTADARRLWAARARLVASGVGVLHEDHLVLGIAKAAGVLSQPGPEGESSLVDLLDGYRREAEGKPGRAYVGLVHRLDRNVSGAMVVAKSSKAASRLSAAFRAREGVEKVYLAWVAGAPPVGEVALATALRRDAAARATRAAAGDQPGGAREARLLYACVGRAPGFARLVVRLETGVTHQIRAQLAAEGLPIVGDAKYGGPPAPRAARSSLARDRIALHAWRLTVPHPVGGAPLALVAPLPADLRGLDAGLRLAPPLA